MKKSDILDGHLRTLLGTDTPVIDTSDMKVLSETRVILQKGRKTNAAKFVERLRSAAGPGAEVSPLFPWYRPRTDLPSLQDFFLVTWPQLDPRSLTVNQYDLAYALQDATKAVSASPDPLVALGPASLESVIREPDSIPDPACVARAAPVDNAQWQLFAANVPAAWSLAPAHGKGIVVGHIDTGVVPHRLLPEPRLDLAGGFDFLRPGSPPVDPLPAVDIVDGFRADIPGHGTFSSSVIGAEPDATTTFSGTAPGVTIRPVRVTRSVVMGPVGPLSFLAQALCFLTASGVDVISISLGGATIAPAMHHALNNAVLNNVIVIAAAGQVFREVALPAALRNCIAVAGAKLIETTNLSNDFAVMRDRMTLWSRSAHGQKVAIAAPAKDIRHGSPDRENPTGPHSAIGGPSQGTTFATATVAGVAALWLEFRDRAILRDRYRNFRSLQSVFKKLLGSSAYVPPNWRWNWGPGVLDAEAVLKASLPPGAPSGPSPSFAGFVAQHEGHDVLEWFEDLFPDLSPEALRAGLRRLLGAGSEAELRARIDQLGAELLTRLASDAGAAEHFVAASVAEASSDAAAAAEEARRSAEGIAGAASRRLRDAFGL